MVVQQPLRGGNMNPIAKDDETAHQDATQICIAFAFYRLSCPRINQWLHVACYCQHDYTVNEWLSTQQSFH
jgi:hypothetical protein